MARIAGSTVSINNSPGCNIPRVIIGNRRDAYASSAALGVDHLPIADIDCDMAHAGNIPMDGHNNDIPRQKLIPRHTDAVVDLPGRCPVQGIAKLLIDIACKARAVKARLRAGASPGIGIADIPQRQLNDGLGLCRWPPEAL